MLSTFAIHFDNHSSFRLSRLDNIPFYCQQLLTITLTRCLSSVVVCKGHLLQAFVSELSFGFTLHDTYYVQSTYLLSTYDHVKHQNLQSRKMYLNSHFKYMVCKHSFIFKQTCPLFIFQVMVSSLPNKAALDW